MKNTRLNRIVYFRLQISSTFSLCQSMTMERKNQVGFSIINEYHQYQLNLHFMASIQVGRQQSKVASRNVMGNEWIDRSIDGTIDWYLLEYIFAMPSGALLVIIVKLKRKNAIKKAIHQS